MRKITVAVDEETYRLVCIRAAEMGTSVSAMVRGYLWGLAADSACAAGKTPGKSDQETGEQIRARELKEVFADFDARGVGLRITENLSRDELYDEAMNSKLDAVR